MSDTPADGARRPDMDLAIRFMGDLIGGEVRRMVNRMLFKVVSVVCLLVLGLALTLVGVLRLSATLVTLCGRWLGDPLLGDVLAGAILLLISLAILVLAWRRLRL